MSNVKQKTNKLLSIATHALAWIVLVSLPFDFAAIFSNKPLPPFDLGMLWLPLELMFLFYFNYLFLINKFLFDKRIILFVFINIVLIVVLGIITIQVHLYFSPHGGNLKSITFPMIIGFWARLVIVGASVSIKMTKKWYEAHHQMAALMQANTNAELLHLKSQLNPHFLFNSLNNIYALIAFKPTEAQLSLHNLCDMLRYQLYEANRETIPLQKEIDFMQSYCDLMRLRLTDDVTLEINLPTEGSNIMIAPLLFISIIENAFKHGISQSEKSFISISLSVDSRGYVICVVRNSFHPKTDSDRSGSGIGLENLNRRLELLYPNNHSFRAEKIGEEFVAQLTIKY